MAVLTKHPHLFNKHHCTFLVNLNRNQQSSHAKINSSRLDQPAVISTLLYNTKSSYFSFCTTGVVRFSFKNWINEVVETTPIYIHSIIPNRFFFHAPAPPIFIFPLIGGKFWCRSDSSGRVKWKRSWIIDGMGDVDGWTHDIIPIYMLYFRINGGTICVCDNGESRSFRFGPSRSSRRRKNSWRCITKRIIFSGYEHSGSKEKLICTIRLAPISVFIQPK